MRERVLVKGQAEALPHLWKANHGRTGRFLPTDVDYTAAAV